MATPLPGNTAGVWSTCMTAVSWHMQRESLPTLRRALSIHRTLLSRPHSPHPTPPRPPTPQVLRQLLPAVVTLAGDQDEWVWRAGVAAAGEIWRALPHDAAMQEALQGRGWGVGWWEGVALPGG